MKRLIFVILFITSALTSFAQGISLPIETTFRDGMILLTVPPAYNSPEYLPMVKPRYVHTLRTLKNKEYNPSFKEMAEQIHIELSKANATSAEEKMNYLRFVCLYIYVSNNNTNKLPVQAREIITALTSDKSSNFQEEVNLTADYLKFADEMTAKFGPNN